MLSLALIAMVVNIAIVFIGVESELALALADTCSRDLEDRIGCDRWFAWRKQSAAAEQHASANEVSGLRRRR